MAKEIKTKTVNKNIKALNRTVTAAEHMKNAYVKTREGAENTQREESTPETYAEGKVANVAERAAGESLHQIRTQGEKAGNRRNAAKPHIILDNLFATASSVPVSEKYHAKTIRLLLIGRGQTAGYNDTPVQS